MRRATSTSPISRTERIHRVGLDGKVSVFREKSGRANGLMFNAAGELVACEGGNGRVVAIARDGKTLRVLADKYKGKRFNAPNDLVIDKRGRRVLSPIPSSAGRSRSRRARSPSTTSRSRGR